MTTPPHPLIHDSVCRRRRLLHWLDSNSEISRRISAFGDHARACLHSLAHDCMNFTEAGGGEINTQPTILPVLREREAISKPTNSPNEKIYSVYDIDDSFRTYVSEDSRKSKK